MIWTTYHLFGSGSAGTKEFVRPNMTARQYAELLDKYDKLAVLDGDDDFVATFSLPEPAADACRADGLLVLGWFDPGPKAPDRVEGYVQVRGYRRTVRAAVAAGYGDLPVNEATARYREAAEK